MVYELQILNLKFKLIRFDNLRRYWNNKKNKNWKGKGVHSHQKEGRRVGNGESKQQEK